MSSSMASKAASSMGGSATCSKGSSSRSRFTRSDASFSSSSSLDAFRITAADRIARGDPLGAMPTASVRSMRPVDAPAFRRAMAPTAAAARVAGPGAPTPPTPPTRAPRGCDAAGRVDGLCTCANTALPPCWRGWRRDMRATARMPPATALHSTAPVMVLCTVSDRQVLGIG